MPRPRRRRQSAGTSALLLADILLGSLLLALAGRPDAALLFGASRIFGLTGGALGGILAAGGTDAIPQRNLDRAERRADSDARRLSAILEEAVMEVLPERSGRLRRSVEVRKATRTGVLQVTISAEYAQRVLAVYRSRGENLPAEAIKEANRRLRRRGWTLRFQFVSRGEIRRRRARGRAAAGVRVVSRTGATVQRRQEGAGHVRVV